MDRQAIQRLRLQHSELRGQQRLKQQELQQKEEHLSLLAEEYSSALAIRQYVQIAAQQVQRRFAEPISNVINQCLSYIWDNPYGFEMEFVNRANRSACQLWLTRQGHRIDALEGSGGGVCDILSFALQVAYLVLRRTLQRHIGLRAILILDEPFRNLHGEEVKLRCSEMVRWISEEYNIQIIMVSDIQELKHAAHKIFEFQLIDGVTYVEIGE